MNLTLIIPHFYWYNTTSRGRRIMANIPAFQASDASSILAARTIEKDSVLLSLFLWSTKKLLRIRISKQLINYVFVYPASSLFIAIRLPSIMFDHYCVIHFENHPFIVRGLDNVNRAESQT